MIVEKKKNPKNYPQRRYRGLWVFFPKMKKDPGPCLFFDHKNGEKKKKILEWFWLIPPRGEWFFEGNFGGGPKQRFNTPPKGNMVMSLF